MIDRKKYRLLVELFQQLSERGEVKDNLGFEASALQLTKWFFGILMAVVAIGAGGDWRPPMIVSAFFIFSVLLSEAGTSLMNPVEGAVLAHQPIDGMTYTTAKLTHLVRVLSTLVLALGAGPAVIPLLRGQADWSYPLRYMLGLSVVGVCMGLVCCGLYGWLFRLIPARRLRAASQLLAALPLTLFYVHDLFRGLGLERLLPLPVPALVALGLVGALLVGLGLRSFSIDYLIRVSSISHSGAKAHRRRDLGWLVPGGQQARAGYSFVTKMMRRDYRFRSALAGSAPMFLMGLVVPLYKQGVSIDPFQGEMMAIHQIPHFLGVLAFLFCMSMHQTNDSKAAWIFQLIPKKAIGRFANGVHAALFVAVVAAPHLIALPVLFWAWPWRAAAVFGVYSVALSSLYLALSLSLLEDVPFTKQPSARSGAERLVQFVAGLLLVAAVIGIQTFIFFHSPARLALAAAGIGAAAFTATRFALHRIRAAFEFDLASSSGEGGMIYKEVEV